MRTCRNQIMLTRRLLCNERTGTSTTPLKCFSAILIKRQSHSKRLSPRFHRRMLPRRREFLVGKLYYRFKLTLNYWASAFHSLSAEIRQYTPQQPTSYQAPSRYVVSTPAPVSETYFENNFLLATFSRQQVCIEPVVLIAWHLD